MINMLSAIVLAVCGAFLIIRYQDRKIVWDFHLILAMWSLLLAGINLAKFF